MNKQRRAVFAALVLAAMSTPLLADSDGPKLEELEAQIKALQARIAALEARNTFASFMPDFAERFHVMHHAGDSGDWAVASHELEEMKRLTGLSISIDAEKGKLMQEIMEPNFEALEHSIEHGNGKKFQRALTQTTEACNACHTATGSGFIQVMLDVNESPSLRHPHKFQKQGAPSGHTH